MQPITPKRTTDLTPNEPKKARGNENDPPFHTILPSNPPAPPKTPMRGRAEDLRPPQLIPVYGDDPDNPTDEPTHFTFKPNNNYLVGIFGANPVEIKKFKQGTCWQVWTCPKFPDLVVKTPLATVDPKSQASRIKGTLNDLKKEPPFSVIKVLSLAGDNDLGFQVAEASKMIVQQKAQPVNLDKHFEKIREILCQIATNESHIQDFYPGNVGEVHDELILFDPDYQQHDEDAWKIEVQEYFLAWAGGTKNPTTGKWENFNPELLSRLLEPLPTVHWVKESLQRV